MRREEEGRPAHLRYNYTGVLSGLATPPPPPPPPPLLLLPILITSSLHSILSLSLLFQSISTRPFLLLPPFHLLFLPPLAHSPLTLPLTLPFLASPLPLTLPLMLSPLPFPSPLPPAYLGGYTTLMVVHKSGIDVCWPRLQ